MVRLALTLLLLFAPALAQPCEIRRPMLNVMIVVAAQMGGQAYITSACEGEHGPGSLHPHGYALDFRIRDIPNAKRPALAEAVSEALGDDYDVVLEPTHLHVEYDPD